VSADTLHFLDCTLRDGGYYNDWDFDPALIARYLQAARAAGVDIVELGFRFVKTDGFKGPCAYTSDAFIEGLTIPEGLTVAVMLNAADLHIGDGVAETLAMLFPRPAADTPVEIVRIACHAREFAATLPAADWLAARGYRVGFNIMQITERTRDEVTGLAAQAAQHPVEVLYFADSMGGMTPDQTRQIIGWMREAWDGPLGVHTHDNMGLALSNTLAAIDAGATWLDATVTGMGRGPGNARTEELALELAERRPGRAVSFSALMDLVARDFGPMKAACGWGTNPFYYLSGKYGIHPTYLQEMLADPRFSTDDVLAVIDHLRDAGGTKFDAGVMVGARHGRDSGDAGDWAPAGMLAGRPVLILGNGASVARHGKGLEAFIADRNPVTLGLNTMAAIDPGLIDLRLACHPLRIMADAGEHADQPQPLVTPTAALADDVRAELGGKALRNFGLRVAPGAFEVSDTGCAIPARLVGAYALALAIAGRASHIYLAGFDGFPADDPRAAEMQEVFDLALAHPDNPGLTLLTPTRFQHVPVRALYGMIR
jgi:4-hydroxy 2-oxovalerate aldolase